MEDSTIQKTLDLSQGSKVQSSQGLLVQTYCNSVIAQPSVDLSGTENLGKFQQEINDGITTAKGHANDYLRNIQPLIITNVTNISNYYEFHKAVATSLPAGTSVKDWVASLNDLKDQSNQYQSDAKAVVLRLQTLNGNLGSDSAAFAKIVSQLNAAVNGDHGILESLDGQLGTMQSKIDGAIAGIALSGFAIIGGIFITAVGAIADFVTAGTTTPLVIGGIALILAGVAGEIGSGLALASLNNEKNKLLLQKSSLTSEVNLALGMKSGYSSLSAQAQTAMQAASQMSNAWGFLSGDLGSLISDLEKGIAKTDMLRTIWLKTANSAIGKVLDDTNIIKNQMSGVINREAPKGKLIGDFATELAKEYSNAA